MTIVRETERQKHVVKVLGERIWNNNTIFFIDFVKLSGEERRSLAAEKKELEKKLSESEKKNMKSELTNIGLRNKVILFG